MAELEALERVRVANPVPDEDQVGGPDLTALFAAMEERRSTMSTGMRERNRAGEERSRRRLMPALVFSAALVLVLVGIGLIPLLLRNDDVITPVDEPVITTMSQPVTTAAPEPPSTAEPQATITTEATPVPPTASVSGEWSLAYESPMGDVGALVALPDGGFVAAGYGGDHIMWSPDGVEWLDADPDGVIERDAGWIEHGVPIGDRVILAGHTCEGGGDIGYEPVPCPMEVGIWVGDPRTGEWQGVTAEDTDLTSCAISGADECWTSADGLATSAEGALVMGVTTSGPPVEQGGWLMYQTSWASWRSGPDVSQWTRADLPDPLHFGSVIWQQVVDGEAAGEYRYGPATSFPGGWLMSLEVETWSAEGLFESFLLRSADGETWTVVSGAPDTVRGITSGGGTVVAIGGVDQDVLYRSADGENWEEVFSEGRDTWFSAVTYSEEYGYVALASVPVDPPATPPTDDEMGEGDRDIDLFISEDGTGWARVGAAATTDARRDPRSVAVSGDIVLVSGYGFEPAGSSPDGVTGIWMLDAD